MLHARPHLSVHSRKQNHSAVAGAAYRLGLRLYDERAGVWHDYTHRKPGEAIVHADTIAPFGAPAWATDPTQLWNRVERMEKRKDSQLARDYRVPIPLGLTDQQAGDMARMLAQFVMRELGTPVSFAVHRDADVDAFGLIKPPSQQGFHAHLYFPTRRLLLGSDEGGSAEGGEGTGQGFGPKLKQFVNQAAGSAMTEQLNAQWARVANLIAGRTGLPTTYDHRSYRRMGVPQQPEPKLGQAATALERRGVRTRQGDQLRAHRAARPRTTPTRLPTPIVEVPFDPFAMPSTVTAGGDPFAAPVVSARVNGAAVAKPVPLAPSDSHAALRSSRMPEEPVDQESVASVTPTSAEPVAVLAEPGPTLAAAPQASTPGWGQPVLRLRSSSTFGNRPRLTMQDRLESPVTYEPVPIVGLAERFKIAAAAHTASNDKDGRFSAIVRLVQAIERALNALIQVGRALLNLEHEHKRCATAVLDLRYETGVKNIQRDTFRRQVASPQPSFKPGSKAHHQRLAAIQRLDEEMADRYRSAASLEEQIKAIDQRMEPWRGQAIEDRRRVKQQLAALAAEGDVYVETLLSVANPQERPWIAMYRKTSEPQKSLQEQVDRNESTSATLRPRHSVRSPS